VSPAPPQTGHHQQRAQREHPAIVSPPGMLRTEKIVVPNLDAKKQDGIFD
jgi:hypothetical protein